MDNRQSSLLNMKISNDHSINVLDLPDEVLLSIFNKLSMVDVFYSLVYVNKRFNRLTLDPFYIHNLNLTGEYSSLQQTSRLDSKEMCKIFKNILLRIHHYIYKLTVPSNLIEYIINVDYPQLQSLALTNFTQKKLLECLTGETIVYRLLTNQIKQLSIDIMYDENESNIFSLILSLAKYLTDLMFHNRFLPRHLKDSTFVLSSIHISSTLTKLTINVTTFCDCLYLLDGSLQSLTALIIDIVRISEPLSTIDNTKMLLKLKQFSLTSERLTFAFDEKVVPLLRRMINIADLTLFLNVGRLGSGYTNNYINDYIDGTHLYNDVLAFMPQLHKFTFSIITWACINDIGCPSNEFIQNSFIEKGIQHVGSYVHNRLHRNNGRCHVFSLPYQFNTFLLLSCNSFQGNIFDRVRSMKMIDSSPFEHELFQKISQHFPFLRNLTVDNEAGQNNKQRSSAFITFPHLERLDITFAHTDYTEQFLYEKHTHLPRLLELHVDYDTLTIITNNFTNDLARANCSNIRHLFTKELYVPSEDFHLYFPLLEI